MALYYITKYALSAGIYTKEGEVCHGISEKMISCPGRYGENYHKPYWHETWEEAVAQAEKQRAKRIKSLEKSLNELRNRKFVKP